MAQMAGQSDHMGMTCHALGRPGVKADTALVPVTFRLDNYAHIERAYGAEVARGILSQVARVLRERLRGDGMVVAVRDGRIDTRVSAAGVAGKTHREGLPAWIDGVCVTLPLASFPTSAGPLHVWISATARLAGADPAEPASIVAGSVFRGQPVGDGAAWAARYRADMRLVAACLASFGPQAMPSVDAVPLSLAWQPVCDAHEPSWILYREALLRGVGSDGQSRSLGDAMRAIERLGFARLIDRQVVAMVLAALESSPDVVLGVNISAQSAARDSWWADVEARLRTSPEVASRLIVEITETAAIPDIGAAVCFTRRLRRLGCRIAIDDFGTGHASIRQVLALSPDIVKIDRLFLQRAGVSDAGRTTLEHLAGLARSIGATVVVEGVETESDARIASEVGLYWQQGYLYGKPGISRLWERDGPENDRGSRPPDSARETAFFRQSARPGALPRERETR